MSTVLTSSTGDAPTGVSINDTRRIFNFGERVAELAPAQSPFFVYLSKVAKKSTDDPVFKFMERRHQWQRRNFEIKTEVTLTVNTGGTAFTDADNSIILDCGYNKYGKTQALSAPRFLLPGQVIAIEDSTGTVRRMKIDVTPAVGGEDGEDGITTIAITDGVGISLVGTWTAGTVTFPEDAKGQVIGSAWAEGTTDPNGWKDAISTNEGYCQIFKTAINMFSGTALATRYRGVANEYKRVWQEKLMEHKMDIEHAMLFGVGTANGTDNTGSNDIRYSWGILPYTEQFGNTYDFTYADSGYDTFLDTMENFFAPETGNSGSKLVLASRKVITFLNKLGDNGFLNNTVGSSQYRLDVTNIPGSFGHNVTKVNTIYGDLHFVAEPLLRGLWEDYAIAIDLKNVAYRPLIGNGISRDTHIITNVQNNNVDGRKDIIMTEAGLEISLPETHAILKFS